MFWTDMHLTNSFAVLLVDDTCLQAGMPFFEYASLCETSG